jgi:cell division septation protein DedD
VNQAEDRSYYEISLTNGQVLFAFAVLLVCVFGAFVSGMWVAREAIGPVEVPASATPGRVEGEARGVIDFFDGAASQTEPDDDEPPPVQQVRPLPPDSSLRTRLAPERGDAASADGVLGDGARADRGASSSTSAAKTGSSAAKTESTAEPPATDTDRRASASAAEAGTGSQVPAPTSGFVIQVFSSNDETQANALLNRLRDSGYRVFRQSESVDGRTMYRVRVGPYPDRPAAEREARQLKQRFKVETWVTASG